MKRLPLVLAVLTGSFLFICFLEYGFRGLNPGIDSNWISQPAWWQSDWLADRGIYLWFYAADILSPLERVTGDDLQVLLLVGVLAQLLFIVAVAVIVFYATRLLFRLSGLTMRSSERPLQGRR